MRPGPLLCHTATALRTAAALRTTAHVGLTRVYCVRGFSIAGKEFAGKLSVKLERGAPTPAGTAVAGGA